jgi:hypothetical protein
MQPKLVSACPATAEELTMTTPSFAVCERTLIPDLLSQVPHVRPVLDRYGLRGCGGPTGPVETLAFFARAHDVPLARLLDELNSAASGKQVASQPAHAAPSLADAIYRPFFVSGIVVVLTLGAVWGAYLLLRIGLTGSFAAASLHEINAHGHAQIFGWVGLFVMGFAYQAFPRFKHTSLTHPRLAVATLVLLVAGLAARSLAHPLVEHWSWLWWVAVAGSVAEVAAIGLFVAIILKTLATSRQPWAHYDYYILSSLVWFVVQAVYEGIYLTATLSATGESLPGLVATWQAPLRDLQIHGFALLMILGVSQRAFHHFYGLPAPSAKVSLVVLPVLNVAVIGEATGLVLMRQIGPAWAALWYGSVIALAVATAVLVAGWRIYSPAPDGDRTLKFLRIAYVWLLVSLAMLVMLPLHQAAVEYFAPASHAAQIGFSHAYYGAARHAITVGFVSLMIVGVAAKVVPTLNGIDGRTLRPLWLPFVLINAGCLLRVLGQIATDFTPIAFPIAGISGLLEVTGLAIWGGHLVLIMAGRARIRTGTRTAALAPLAGREICSADTVAAVLDDQPQLLEAFLAAGFTQLASSYARNTMARVVTLRQACQRRELDAEKFVAELNATRRRLRTQREPLLSIEPADERNTPCHVA